MLQAIIFDLDGTLVDSESLYTNVWKQVAPMFNRTYTADLKRKLYGIGGMLNAVNLAVEHWELNVDPNTVLTEILKLSGNMQPKDIELMTGTKELLELLTAKGIRRAIATGSNRTWAEAILVHHGIQHHFEHLVTVDDVTFAKPHPETYVKTLERLCLQPDECIAIEDSPNGIRSARGAGLRTVAVKSPYATADEIQHAQHFVDGLHKIDHHFLDSLSQKH
jgi:HAD superfamily hydrolase (TIGR01509 family)